MSETVDVVQVEIAETEAALSRLRSARPWNPQMKEKLDQQIAACQRSLARLKAMTA